LPSTYSVHLILLNMIEYYIYATPHCVILFVFVSLSPFLKYPFQNGRTICCPNLTPHYILLNSKFIKISIKVLFLCVC
jgi:hypothetical protein